MRFVVDHAPSTAGMALVERLVPANAFATVAYARARQSLGESCLVLGLESDTAMMNSACFAFIREGRVNRSMEVPSLPAMDRPDVFYAGLLNFCHARRVTVLEVNSYASPSAEIAPLPRERVRHARLEWVLDLSSVATWEHLASNHRRSISRARRLGIRIRRTNAVTAVIAHCRLMETSMERRTRRGEAVDFEPGSADAFARMVVESGAGVIYQACLAEEVLASVLILLAQRGAYYHSAGNAPAGMKAGASAFLVASIAEALAHENKEVLNLGDARPDNAGLYRFKSGFGARQVPLASVVSCPFTIRQSPIAAVLYFGRHLLGGMR